MRYRLMVKHTLTSANFITVWLVSPPIVEEVILVVYITTVERQVSVHSGCINRNISYVQVFLYSGVDVSKCEESPFIVCTKLYCCTK
jgi:hypothetical protein